MFVRLLQPLGAPQIGDALLDWKRGKVFLNFGIAESFREHYSSSDSSE
jgi:hypothetical protein